MKARCWIFSGTANSLGQVKHFLQLATDWAVIRVSWHNVGHIFPPTLANISAGYRIPPFFRFNLYRGKQQITRFVEVNGVVMRTVRFQHCFQFRPDGVMPTLILFVGVGLTCITKALRIMFAPYSASALASGVTPKRWPSAISSSRLMVCFMPPIE